MSETTNIPILFRWRIQYGGLAPQCFLASSAQELYDAGFQAINEYNAVTGNSVIQLQSRTHYPHTHTRVSADWRTLPGPLPWPDSDAMQAWPEDLGALEEELYQRAEALFAEALLYYAPVTMPTARIPPCDISRNSTSSGQPRGRAMTSRVVICATLERAPPPRFRD